MKRKTLIWIILAALALAAIDCLCGCSKSAAGSDSPMVFIIVKKEQTKWDLRTGVALYKVERWSSYATAGNFKRLYDTDWYTLEDKFKVGDTLHFVKK